MPDLELAIKQATKELSVTSTLVEGPVLSLPKGLSGALTGETPVQPAI